MHRPQAVGLGAVMLSLLVLCLSSTAVVAQRPIGLGPIVTPARLITPDAFELARTAKQAVKAGTTEQACSGWRSTVMPPPTVRILRTNSPTAGVNGKVQEVDFRDYVETVIAAEWPAYYPIETLKAGAIAVKQFAWYYAVVYRGGISAQGECYDMQDNTNDQYYQPEKRNASPSHIKAFNATWSIHLRKLDRDTGRGRFILTGYRSGAQVECGVDHDGFRFYQHSAFRCGRDGLTLEQILRKYLDPRLEIVIPGDHDILGSDPGSMRSEAGDVSAVIERPKGALVPHVWQVTPGAIALAEPMELDLNDPSVIGYLSEDASGDGWDDLVVARKIDPLSVRLTIHRSNGEGYGGETRWFEGDLGVDPAGGRFLGGDFTGDGRNDVALLVPGPKGTQTLFVFAHKSGAGFKAPVIWWTGSLDGSTSRVWAGDVNGDGRQDLIVRIALDPVGIRYLTAVSSTKGGSLFALKERYLAEMLTTDRVLHVLGDANRDGREDLMLLVSVLKDGEPYRTRLEVLLAPPGKTRFKQSVAWTTPNGQPLPFGQLKVIGGDVDYDGLGDVVLFRDRNEGGTQITTLVTPSSRPTGGINPYGSMYPGVTILDESVTPAALHPY